MPDNFSNNTRQAVTRAAVLPDSRQEIPQTRKVVCRLSALGDVALLTGVLDYWAREHGWRFTVLTRQQYAPLFLNHPAVDEVVGLTAADLKNAASSFKELARRFAGQELLDLHASLRSRLLALLWQGRVRRYPKFSLRRRLFLRCKGRGCSERLRRFNVPQRYALAVESAAPPAPALAPKIYLSAQEREEAGRRLARIFPNGEKGLVILHPYATHSRKEWPAAYWRELILKLERHGLNFLVVGQGEPLPGLYVPGAAPDARDFSNATSLRELCAILERGSVLVTGDSGPMHLGVGVGLPVLALFGPTTREWGFYPPEGKNKVLELNMPCRPCSLHGGDACPGDGGCMNGITPELVFENIMEMRKGGGMLEYLRLGGSGPSGPGNGNAKKGGVTPVEAHEAGCLVSLSAPTPEELEQVSSRFGIPMDHLTDSLDPSERPYMVTEQGVTLIVFRVPYRTGLIDKSPYRTVSLGLILAPTATVAVCGRADLIRSLLDAKTHGPAPDSGLTAALSILFRACALYITYLQELYAMTEKVEQAVHRSMRNEDLAAMMQIEKALVYFATSLKGNYALLEKMQATAGFLKPEQKAEREILDDAATECRQAADMAGIYIQIISTINETAGALISNNMSMAMRFLAAITLILTVPMVIVGFYGMNVGLPLQESPWAAILISAVTAVICLILWRYLSRKHWM
jgi:ADP-heptose:LPS heptosyltransferase/Mg2+ and Co2+ transporter CorA